MFLHVTSAEYIKDYKIELLFNNKKKGVADLEDILRGHIFEPLKEKTKFSQFKVDQELETICWENGADLAPEYLYFKAFKNEPDLQEQFKQWGYLS